MLDTRKDTSENRGSIYVLVCRGLSVDDVGVSRDTVFQGFETGNIVKEKLGGATVVRFYCVDETGGSRPPVETNSHHYSLSEIPVFEWEVKIGHARLQRSPQFLSPSEIIKLASFAVKGVFNLGLYHQIVRTDTRMDIYQGLLRIPTKVALRTTVLGIVRHTLSSSHTKTSILGLDHRLSQA